MSAIHLRANSIKISDLSEKKAKRDKIRAAFGFDSGSKNDQNDDYLYYLHLKKKKSSCVMGNNKKEHKNDNIKDGPSCVVSKIDQELDSM